MQTNSYELSKMMIQRGFKILALFLVLLCASFTSDVRAQKLLRLLHYADSMLTARYRSSDIDTAYIMRPQTKWTLTARKNWLSTTASGSHAFSSVSDYRLCKPRVIGGVPHGGRHEGGDRNEIQELLGVSSL